MVSIAPFLTNIYEIMTDPRRNSLAMLLRRSKSGDFGRSGSKRAQQLRDQELQRQKDAVSNSPPRLPQLYNGASPPALQSFGSLDAKHTPDSLSGPEHKHSHHSHRPSSGLQSIAPGRPSMSSSPPVPSNSTSPDPYARTESMTHRGRYSYAGSALLNGVSSPRRVRRRKDPTPFNILIMGSRGAGKTCFLDFLKKALALPPKKQSQRANETGEKIASSASASRTFIPHYLETEIDGERIGLTLWDSEGLEKNAVDLQLREVSLFLENKFEETFAEEMKVIRSPGVQDTHIHAVFLVLDPARLDRNIAAAKAVSANGSHAKLQPTVAPVQSGLDEDLDLQVMRTLQGKTTVIPVISKADTITTAHMAMLKKTVWASLKKANFDPLEALGLDDDDIVLDSGTIDEGDEDGEAVQVEQGTGQEAAVEPSDYAAASSGGHPPELGEEGGGAEDSVLESVPDIKRRSNPVLKSKATADEVDAIPFLPMSIISPDPYEPEVIGRKFPWGFADPYNESHCDFIKLKDAVFSEWRGDLREASREQWYEGWRTSRLKHREPSRRQWRSGVAHA